MHGLVYGLGHVETSDLTPLINVRRGLYYDM